MLLSDEQLPDSVEGHVGPACLFPTPGVCLRHLEAVLGTGSCVWPICPIIAGTPGALSLVPVGNT